MFVIRGTKFAVACYRPAMLALAVLALGCRSPGDGRPRGDGPGADGGNFRRKPLPVPSKIDGTRTSAPPWAAS